VREFGPKPPLGKPEAIVWLLSDKASLITGAVLDVMGAQR